jgi:hypothetical protein
MISVPRRLRRRSTNSTFFKRGVLALGMPSSSQHVYSDEISDSRHTWQLILECTRATPFDVQQYSSSCHCIEVLSLAMQVFQIMHSCWPQLLEYMSTASVCLLLDIPSKLFPHSQSLQPEKNRCPKNLEHMFTYQVCNTYVYIRYPSLCISLV